jgi:hypothetical protein
MTIQDIRDALEIIDGTLTVSAATLNSNNITWLLDNFIPEQTLIINQAVITSQTSDDFVLVTGKSDLLSVELDVSARFYISQGQAELKLTGTPSPDWNFSTSFASLTGNYFDEFNAQNVTFVFISLAEDDYESGLNFTADFQPPAAWDILMWFANPGNSPTLSGPITFEQGEPIMTLTVNPIIQASLGGYLDLDLSLQNLCKAIPNPRDPTTPLVITYSQLSGNVSFTRNNTQVDLPILAIFSTDLSVLKFNINTEQVFDVALSEIAHLVNGIDLGTQGLPEYFRPPAGLTLHDIGFAIGLRTQRLEYVTVDIQSTTNWVVIEQVIEFEQIAINFMVLKPTVSADIIVTMNGRVNLAGVEMDVFAQVPDFQISGHLAEGASPDLTPLLEHQLGSAQGVPDTLKIEALQFSAHPSGSSYSFDIDVEGQWQIASGLALEGIGVGLAYQRVGEIAEISGYLRALFGLSNIDITIAAEYGNDSQGWQFEGSTGQDQPIPIGDLIDDLTTKFGNVRPPAAVSNLIFENLKVSFNTQTKDFTFNGEAKFPAANTEVDITLAVDLTHQADGAFNNKFAGHLTIGDLQFALMFDSRPNAKAFIAAFHDSQGVSISVDDLLSPFVEVDTGLSFILYDALFAYQSDTDPQGQVQTKYLFGLDIEGGLNLSDIKLPGLPLTGSTASPDETLALGFQVLVPSVVFTADQVTALNGLISGNSLNLPQKELQPPVNLSIVLRIGQDKILVELPIGLSTQSNGQGNGLVNQDQAQVTTTSPSGAQAASNDGTQWLKIQKAFGPVYFERIGLKYESGQITALLDAALSTGGLTLSLDGLAMTSPLDHFAPEFSLRGLGLDYQNGPLEIGGSLLRLVTEHGTEYDGLAVIRTEALTLVAIGSYANFDGHPSLFIYAVLDYPLGGPSFFFVTGLAAGFGYNRSLQAPPLEQVATFPLVAQVIGGSTPPSLPTDQAGRQQTLTGQLKQLSQYIPPTIGESFLAVGIKFTSFKQIDSFAMLVVQFGNHFEIDVLGLSVLKMPSPDETGSAVTPLGEARLALRARFAPDEGGLTVRAQLTSDSYILSRACHLTGGFAFYTWFDPHPNQGDFVITLGGYHPQYTVPAHYPTVPRLGFNWQVDSSLQLKGGIYFALTPHALMAGGHLEATWQKGSLKAWFKAGADFLITWKPYHYDIELYVDIGASYTFHLFGAHHVKVELGADLHIWGPEFSGKAHVNWYIISFTVRFGHDAAQGLNPIDWPQFKQSFLPEKPEAACGIAVKNGLLRQTTDETENERWIINSTDLVLVTHSVLPANQATIKATSVFGTNTPKNVYIEQAAPNRLRPFKLVDGAIVVDQQDADAQKIAAPGIVPMGVTGASLTITHTIEITREGTPVEADFSYTPILKPMPAGLWGEPEFKGAFLKPPAVNGERLIEYTLAGFEIRPAQPPAPGATADIERRNLRYETELIPEAYAWQSFEFEPEGLTADIEQHPIWQTARNELDLAEAQRRVSWAIIEGTVVTNPETNQTISARRADLLQALDFVDPGLDFGQPMAQDVLFPPQIEQLSDADKIAIDLKQLIETSLAKGQ